MKLLLNLFTSFARIGGLTFGGGYAMLPMLQRELVEDKHWVTEEELMDYYAIGQCTPGVIAINTATFVGYKMAGILGGIFATIGVVFPSWIIITIIAMFVQHFAEYAAVQHALAGITVCVFVLILDAVIKLGKKSLKDKCSILIFLLVFCISLFTNISSAYLIIFSGILGVIICTIKTKIAKNTLEKQMEDIR